MNAPVGPDDESSFLHEYFHALTTDQLQELLRSIEAPTSGNKSKLVDRLLDALQNEVLSRPDLVRFLNETDRWGKQHIFLFEGASAGLLAKWSSPSMTASLAKVREVAPCLNVELPLILPPTLELASVVHSRTELTIVAIEKRVGLSRDPDHDESQLKDGRHLIKKAYVRSTHRGLIAFHWDFLKNEPMLQISQLPSGTKYEDVRDRFLEKVVDWFPLDQFTPLNIPAAIKKLDTMIKAGSGDARTQAVTYEDAGGYKVKADSPSQKASLQGARHVEKAIAPFIKVAAGHQGNFYWLPAVNGASNPLAMEMRTVFQGNKGRVAFTKAHGRIPLLYVLAQIRGLC